MRYVILSEKNWNIELAKKLKNIFINDEFILIASRDKFNIEHLNKINPKFIFIPHWSYIIPEEIFKKFECVVFHMTDLPYGRGGSPLQNLIVRGINFTKISALKVVKELDTGDIYLKKDLTLYGTAEEIFIRADKIIELMIEEIISKNLRLIPQKGEVISFKRRTPEMSSMKNLTTIEEIYDYIRMLDAEGYPHAFIENDNFRFEFTRASIKSNKSIIADVRITKK